MTTAKLIPSVKEVKLPSVLFQAENQRIFGISTYRFRHLTILLLIGAEIAVTSRLWNLSFLKEPFLTGSLQMVSGFLMLCLVSVFHDAAHGWLFRDHRFNVAVGRLFGTFMVLPYTGFRATHLLHHKDPLHPEDWELWPYCDPRTSPAFRRIFAWIDLFFGRLTSPVIYLRIFWSRRSPLKARTRRTIGWEYAASLFFWMGVAAYVETYASWGGFVRVILIPQLLAGSLQALNRMGEHLGRAYGPGRENSRTVFATGPMERTLSALSLQSSHWGPHHDQPLVPAIDLDEWYRKHPEGYPEVFTSYGAAIWDTLKAVALNPDTGVLSPRYQGTFATRIAKRR